MLKYANHVDTIQLLQQLLAKLFTQHSFLDEKREVYLKRFVYYTEGVISNEDKGKLIEILNQGLSGENGEKLMETIAQSYIKQGVEQGVLQGVEQGMLQGEKKRTEAMITNMLKENFNTLL